jgi:DNA-directed RNA polymerase beta subunit
VAEAFAKMELDPEVTKRTLGHPHANVTKEAILAATKKLLAVSRKEAEPDDRDHLAYQTFVGPEDLFSERLRRRTTAASAAGCSRTCPGWAAWTSCPRGR